MLTEKLLAIDPVIIAVYLVVSLLLGIFGSRLLGMNNSKEDDYYLAGRKMPGWLNGMSVAATALNSDVAPLYCGIAVVTGLSGCWFFLSRFGMALLLAAILFAVRWRQMGIRTGPEFFHLRFGAGNKFARVYSSLTSVLIGMVPWIGAGLIGIHLVAAPIFGIDSKAVTLLIVLPLLTVYVWTSGLAGVLLTDALPGFVILAANLVMVGAVLWARGSGFAYNRRFMRVVNGGLGCESVSFPRRKIQFGYTKTNPFQRRAQTATIAVRTAAGTGGTTVRLIDVCEDDAQAWLEWVRPRRDAVS